jgi:hypothetical protein
VQELADCAHANKGQQIRRKSNFKMQIKMQTTFEFFICWNHGSVEVHGLFLLNEGLPLPYIVAALEGWYWRGRQNNASFFLKIISYRLRGLSAQAGKQCQQQEEEEATTMVGSGHREERRIGAAAAVRSGQ